MSRYRRNVYGVLQDNTRALDTASVRDLVAREERRWQQADMDGDLALNIAEFQARAVLWPILTLVLLLQAFPIMRNKSGRHVFKLHIRQKRLWPWPYA